MTEQKKVIKRDFFYSFTRLIATCLPVFFFTVCTAQDYVPPDSVSAHVVDAQDVLKKMFKIKPDTTKPKQGQSMVLLPSLGYNPSNGFVFGAKVAIIRQYGQKENTDLSTFGLEGSYATKGVITVQARHNVFLPGNHWSVDGNWQLSKALIEDYSIGTGNKDYITKSDSMFPLRFTHIRFTEKVFKRLGGKLYAGLGVNINIRYKINDEKLDSLGSSPHFRYSLRNGFGATKYSANSLLLAIAYKGREHPIRSYGGFYADLTFSLSQEWLGSTKPAFQIIYDIRKYFSLSKKNPEHVLAFWHMVSYKLDGTVPYLALPATGYDLYNRMGRGYTIGRFKGLSLSYFETEYRFPITRNKLFSGVAFANVQTASDDLGKKLFQYWDPAAGLGLRILFQKQSRSTVCIDFVRGKYGSNGIFFGLNEAF